MDRSRMILLALTLAPLGSAGCSRTVASVTRQPVAAPAINVCDPKLVSQADIAPILGEAVTSVKPLAGDPQSCVFTTASFSSVTVSLRPGLGQVTVDTWASGKMPVSATPLPGVGDRAVWQSTLHEVISTKNNLLCDTQESPGRRPPPATRRPPRSALCVQRFSPPGRSRREAARPSGLSLEASRDHQVFPPPAPTPRRLQPEHRELHRPHAPASSLGRDAAPSSQSYGSYYGVSVSRSGRDGGRP